MEMCIRDRTAAGRRAGDSRADAHQGIGAHRLDEAGGRSPQPDPRYEPLDVYKRQVCANRLVAIVSPESAPIKRIIQDARDRGTLVDATYGRRTRAVIITDSDHVILSAVQPETVANRLVDEDDEVEDDE